MFRHLDRSLIRKSPHQATVRPTYSPRKRHPRKPDQLRPRSSAPERHAISTRRPEAIAMRAEPARLSDTRPVPPRRLLRSADSRIDNHARSSAVNVSGRQPAGQTRSSRKRSPAHAIARRSPASPPQSTRHNPRHLRWRKKAKYGGHPSDRSRYCTHGNCSTMRDLRRCDRRLRTSRSHRFRVRAASIARAGT